ncbi:MAG: hypothetical protein JOZ47_19325 [Kutzneria sp.]|nr:hypothetical protein [Kutzneria sp.]
MTGGVDWVEIAYRNGPLQRTPELGLTGRGEDDYISAIAEAVGPEHVGLMLHPNNVDEDDISAMYRAGARLLRICTPAHVPEQAMACVRQAKSVGFTVCLHITRVSQVATARVVEVVADAAEAAADVVYLADSNGSMMPAETAALVARCREAVSCELGLHSHNNLGLAMSNAIAAVQAGATWIDSSLLGMGKGPGNLVAEQWLAYLNRVGPVERYDLGTMLNLAQLLGRTVAEAAPRQSPLDLVLGYFDLPVEARGDIAHDDHRQAVHAAESLSWGHVLAGAVAG